MPWEETGDYIRSGHREPGEFQDGTLRTITLSKEQGIKAVVGRPKGKETTEIQSYLFDIEKGWTLDKAKAWFDEHRERKTDATSPVTERILAEPKKISGILALPGWSLNRNLWTPEEIERLQAAFTGAPIYWEHVDGRRAIGKNEFTAYDPALGLLAYYGEVLDEDAADRIEHGMVKTVSLGVNYARVDAIGADGQVPRGPYHDGEISLVAVPSVQGTSVQLAERVKEADVPQGTTPPEPAKTEIGNDAQADASPKSDIVMGPVEDAINKLYIMLNELSDRVAALEKPEPEEDIAVPPGAPLTEKAAPEKAPEAGPKETTSQPAAQPAGGDVPNAPPKAEGVVEPGARPTAPQEFVEKKLIRQLLPDDRQMRMMPVGARTHLEAIRKEVD